MGIWGSRALSGVANSFFFRDGGAGMNLGCKTLPSHSLSRVLSAFCSQFELQEKKKKKKGKIKRGGKSEK